MLKTEDKIYFINTFRNYLNNANKEFSRKYTPSLRELLNDYLELHNDIINSLENEKLRYSYKAQLSIMQNFIERSVYTKSSISTDLSFLLAKLRSYAKNKDEKDNKNKDTVSKEFLSDSLCQYCKAILKKIEGINLYQEILDIFKNASSYIEFDLCIEALVNELIYDGYSLVYLQKWYQNTSSEYKKEQGMDYDGFINELIKFKKPKEYFEVYLTMKNDDIEKITNWNIGNSLKVEFVNRESLDEELKTYLQFNSTNRAIKIFIHSMDGYCATFNAIDAMNAYLLIINLINENDFSINNKSAFKDKSNNSITKLNLNNSDSNFLQSSMDKREKYDLQDFISYRTDIYELNIKTGEIASIERSLNILKSASSIYNQQNRLIELWSVLEYLLSYYSSNSIISKAKDIIPKLMCLYMLKDRLNIFWNVLQASINREEEAEEFMASSSLTTNKEKYDVSKLISNIKKNKETLIDKFGYNGVVLNRQYSELGCMIDKKMDLAALIEKTHQMIEDDISRIYRTRNIVVHSGNQTHTNILLKNIRLTRYLSNLLGVILHYKMKNNEITIQEILYSIPATYENYLEELKEFKKSKNTKGKDSQSEDSQSEDSNEDESVVEEIFKPSYLFL